jgi:hypothetical protein
VRDEGNTLCIACRFPLSDGGLAECPKAHLLGFVQELSFDKGRFIMIVICHLMQSGRIKMKKRIWTIDSCGRAIGFGRSTLVDVQLAQYKCMGFASYDSILICKADVESVHATGKECITQSNARSLRVHVHLAHIWSVAQYVRRHTYSS